MECHYLLVKIQKIFKNMHPKEKRRRKINWTTLHKIRSLCCMRSKLLQNFHFFQSNFLLFLNSYTHIINFFQLNKLLFFISFNYLNVIILYVLIMSCCLQNNKLASFFVAIQRLNNHKMYENIEVILKCKRATNTFIITQNITNDIGNNVLLWFYYILFIFFHNHFVHF